MAAPGELTVDVAQPDPPVEPAPPDALAILRDATTCTELTDEDIQRAFERGGEFEASSYLGATAVSHCTENGGDFGAFWANNSLANRIVEAGKIRAGTTAKGRRDEVARLREQQEAHAAGAMRFGGLLAAARTARDAFTQEYTEGDRVSMTRVGELFDATEEPMHPAVAAIEARLAASRDARVRTALIGADRLLRYMILQARTATTSEEVAA